MLEFYLKLNRCPHAPQILYYNYDYDTALYAEEKGEMLTFDDKPFYFHEFFEFNGKMLKDANKLGVYANDINYGNFLLSAADGQLKIIDIGHHFQYAILQRENQRRIDFQNTIYIELWLMFKILLLLYTSFRIGVVELHLG